MPDEIVFLVEEAPAEGYMARALGHSIFTEADSWDDLKLAVQDAVECHFEPAQKPAMICLHLVRQEVFAACPPPAPSSEA